MRYTDSKANQQYGILLALALVVAVGNHLDCNSSKVHRLEIRKLVAEFPQINCRYDGLVVREADRSVLLRLKHLEEGHLEPVRP